MTSILIHHDLIQAWDAGNIHQGLDPFSHTAFNFQNQIRRARDDVGFLFLLRQDPPKLVGRSLRYNNFST